MCGQNTDHESGSIYTDLTTFRNLIDTSMLFTASGPFRHALCLDKTKGNHEIDAESRNGDNGIDYIGTDWVEIG